MKNLIVLKKVLTDEFPDVNSEKVINLLSVLDDLHILIITQFFQDVQILANILRSVIFLLAREKVEDDWIFPLLLLSSN